MLKDLQVTCQHLLTDLPEIDVGYFQDNLKNKHVQGQLTILMLFFFFNLIFLCFVFFLFLG